MHIHRVGTGSLLALSALALLSPSAQAAPPLPRPEPSFMGVRLLATFRDVMKRYGQPMEIQLGTPHIPGTGAPQATTAGAGPGGSPFGGMSMPPGMGARGGAPGSGGSPFAGGMSMPPGLAGPGGGPGNGGSPFAGGMSMPPGMPGGPGSGGLPGFAGGNPFGGGRRGEDDGGRAPGGFPGGLPGFPGGPAAAGASGGGGFPGMGGAGAQAQDPGETTWWYYDKKKGIYRSFLFNKDGKVIQIQLYGYKGGDRTRQNIGLGSTLGQVINRYRWSNDAYRNGDNMLVRYGNSPQRLAFQLAKNQVVGITLAYVK